MRAAPPNRLSPPPFLFALLCGFGAAAQVVGPLELPIEPPATQPRPIPTTRPATTRPAAAQLSRWWADLADRTPAAREAARLGLMGMDAADLPALRRLVATARPVDPAQAALLREVVTHVFLAGRPYGASDATGFLGVNLGLIALTDAPVAARRRAAPAPGESAASFGVVIQSRKAGFCASKVLQDGDVVLGVLEYAAREVHNTEEFRSVILGTGAGVALHLEILRQGRVMVVTVVLDAKPDEIKPEDLTGQIQERFFGEREDASDAYWEKEFAPLLRDILG